MAQRATSPGFWLVAGLCAVLAVTLLYLLLSLFYLDKDNTALAAFERGLRLNITTADGKVSGQVRTLKPDTPVETAPGETAAIPPEAADLVGFDVGPPEENTPSANDQPTALQTAITDSLIGSEDETLDTIPVEPRTNASLSPAPHADLIGQSEAGLVLPKEGGGTSPYAYYSRPFTEPNPRRPIIALVVTDLGAIKAQTESALALPPEVTLAFNPYARHTPVWLKSARNKGHEAWLMLPAQPDDFPASDPGPNALLVDIAAADRETELLPRLHRTLARAQGYSGLVLPVGEAVSESVDMLKWLHEKLAARGLGLIASDKPANSAAAGWFKRESRRYVSHFVLDETLQEAAIASKLQRLEQLARTQGHAMAVLRPYPLSLRQVRDWIDGLPAKGFVLAPASAVIERE